MRKRNINHNIPIKTIVLIIITIFFLTISIGYSYLSEKLYIQGKSSIVAQDIPEDFEPGSSTFTWEIIHAWGGGDASYIYQISISIVNNDEDVETWEVSFDVPDTYDDSSTQSWIASERTYENGRLTLVAQGWNASVPKGGTLTIEFQIAFTEEETDFINNLTLNGLLVTPE